MVMPFKCNIPESSGTFCFDPFAKAKLTGCGLNSFKSDLSNTIVVSLPESKMNSFTRSGFELDVYKTLVDVYKTSE